MIEIPVAEISPALRVLLPIDAPAASRLTAVLDSLAPGRILTDDPKQPTWVIGQESTYGTLYLSGTFDKPLLAQLVSLFRKTGEVLYGFWEQGDPHEALFPPTEYDGRVLEFYERRGDLTAFSIPQDCEIRSFERQNERGFHLMRGDEILSEASVGVPINGIIEMGTETPEAHRRRGYASIVCAHLIRQCEQQGYSTYWNCNKQNIASAALARSLGYYDEKEYRLYAWFPAG